MKCISAGSVMLALVLGGCTSQQQTSTPPPLKIVTEAPAESPAIPPPLTGARLLRQQPAEVQAAIKKHQQDGKWFVYRTPEYTLYPYNQKPEPAVDCAPLRTTDIQLQPGETITDVALGDTERWMATPAASGDPRNAVPHLAVKPQVPGIETNLTIYSTKHIYHLLLRSRGRAMQEVEFYYPDELSTAMRDADAAAASAKQEAVDPPVDSDNVVKVAAVDPAQLNFAYTVAGLIQEQDEQEQEHLGGGRFNRLLGVVFVAVTMVGGVALALGVQSSGTSQSSASQKSADDPGSAARDRSEIEDLAAHGAVPHAAPTVMPIPALSISQASVQPIAPKPPSRYAQWAEEKYMKALESPEMVQAFHSGETLEIASAKGQQADSYISGDQNNPTISVHPAASPYTVMAGSILPAALISGINSDLPGPILAQVSQNVLDSATGRSVLIPQGSRLIGAYQNASSYGQQRVQIAWQRLIFPNTSSMNLPMMPGADQGGYAGFSDQVNNHYLATIGTAAVMSLISAGQMIGQMATLGGGGTYGPYGYYQPNQWAMASQAAGSAASGQFGALGQQMMGQGLNRPPTIEIRPGYQFDVMVTQDLVFPGPYGK